MPNALTRAMNDAVIRRLAGAQSYQRGLDYFSHGHVELLEDRDGSVHAVVRGNQDYTVALAADDGVLDYSCDCPVGTDGAFCKYCVAVALAWLNRATGLARSGRGKAKEITPADAGKILQAEDKDTLVRMVLDWAKDDDRLHERLIVYAARRSGPDTGVAAVRRAFEKAVRVRDFVPYREATGWARGVDDANDSVEQLLNDGQAAAVIELCESALQSLLGAIQAVDDSDGHFGVLRDRLQDIHYRACQEAPPDPAELARRLFQWELHSDFDVFYGAAARYGKILGAKGMKVYRELAESEWEKVPARGSTRSVAKNLSTGESASRTRIRHAYWINSRRHRSSIAGFPAPPVTSTRTHSSWNTTSTSGSFSKITLTEKNVGGSFALRSSRIFLSESPPPVWIFRITCLTRLCFVMAARSS